MPANRSESVIAETIFLFKSSALPSPIQLLQYHLRRFIRYGEDQRKIVWRALE
jgi:hypothetical protein